MNGGGLVFVRRGQMLQDQGHVGIQTRNLAQIGAIVEHPLVGPHLIQVDGEPVVEQDVLGVATLDVGAESGKAVTDESSVLVVAARAVDDVDGSRWTATRSRSMACRSSR
jgi:hypothetical protein